MIINGERSLAYIVAIDDIEPIAGYDRVEYAHVGGWRVIISKNDNLSIGDKCVYFEVDSKVPSDDERFAFLEKRNYKIKTIKMCKVISQGLLMPLSLFPEIKTDEINTDVSKILGVTYAVAEDNDRKAKVNKNAKYQSMAARHQKIFKKKWARWLMRRKWGRKFMFLIFGRKNDKPRQFPSFISRTDEERIENCPWHCGDGKIYLVSEKLDGTSCTYALKRIKKNKYEFYVCSRNVRQQDEKQECYHDHNIYWDMAFKYNIEDHLRQFLESRPDCEWVCLQGEGVGSVQGNPLKLDHDDLYIFNFITSTDGRISSLDGRSIIELWGMQWVPILGMTELPATIEEVKALATGNSVVNPQVMREGFVYRSLDGKESFKNVSREYLLKHNG